LASNGTVFANTTAVKTQPNCHLATTVSTVLTGGGWQNNASFSGCTFSYSVNKTTSHLFDSNVFENCIPGEPSWFQPIVLWFFTYDTSPPQGSATYCAPSISLWEVAVTVDIATGNLTSVKEIRPLNASSTSPLASLSGNITGAPLNGRAYNGIRFNLTEADQFVIARQNATNLQLPSSVLQAATISPGGISGAFATNSFTGMAVNVYVSIRFCDLQITILNESKLDHLSETRCEVGVFLARHRCDHPGTGQKFPNALMVKARAEI
jgi:hypothetical protein